MGIFFKVPPGYVLVSGEILVEHPHQVARIAAERGVLIGNGRTVTVGGALVTNDAGIAVKTVLKR